jgi:hypothetical protein
MTDSILFPTEIAPPPSGPILRHMVSQPSEVDEVLDGLGTALSRWLRLKLAALLVR